MFKSIPMESSSDELHPPNNCTSYGTFHLCNTKKTYFDEDRVRITQLNSSPEPNPKYIITSNRSP